MRASRCCHNKRCLSPLRMNSTPLSTVAMFGLQTYAVPPSTTCSNTHMLLTRRSNLQPPAVQHSLCCSTNTKKRIHQSVQFLADDVFDCFCWQQALCAQRGLVWRGADEDHGGQALDLQLGRQQQQQKGSKQQHQGSRQDRVDASTHGSELTVLWIGSCLDSSLLPLPLLLSFHSQRVLLISTTRITPPRQTQPQPTAL